MKTCPKCQGSYPSNFAVCPQDGTALREVGGWVDGNVIRGKYRLLSKVGQGGMGAVWKATHLAFDELRALKVIAPELVTDESFVKRFKHEAVITRKLQHPNAVRVDDIDEAEDGRPFIVMEFIEGKSLKKLIHDEGPLPVERTCTIIKQTAAALDAAHRLGMVHRDIKPDNIALVDTPDGEMVKVLDFGIAKVKEARIGEMGGMTLTGTGVVIGTPQYMSPEQAMGKRGDELDGRADLYSLGIVMYQMLTADLPFKADTTMEMLLAHMQKPPAPIRVLHPELNVPDAVAALTMRLLEKSRDMRPASARVLIQEIEQAEAEMDDAGATRVVLPGDVLLNGARPAPVRDLTATAGTIPPRREPSSTPPPAPPQPASRAARPQPAAAGPAVLPVPQPKTESRWGIWVALIVLVVGLGGGGLYIFRKPSAPAIQEQTVPQQSPVNQSPATQPVEQPPAEMNTTTPAASPSAPLTHQLDNTTPSHARAKETERRTNSSLKASVQKTQQIQPAKVPQPAAPDPKVIQPLITEGDVMYRRADYDAALGAYQQGLKLDPANSILKEKYTVAKRACMTEKAAGTTTSKCEPQ